ncbi:MAG: type II secretion system F family protein [Thaumarchaeota archaeon]|nr:type II secretion system F family protein [Nitrososphaerota archaeon]
MTERLVLPGMEKHKPLLTKFDALTRACFLVFQNPSGRISAAIPQLRDNILKSNMRITPEALISLDIFFTAIAAGIVTVITYIGVVVLHVIFFALLPVSIPIIFMLILNFPRFSASNRGASIDNELPFVVGYLSVLAGGGVSPLVVMRRISKMTLFPATSKEAKRILMETEVFGNDPITAMERVARWNPSRNFSEFLFGYTSVLKSGGDFVSYIQVKLKDILDAKSAQVKRATDTTGTMAEAYLTITVILGMTLYTLYMIQTLLSGSLNGLTNLYFFAFGIVPLISAGFMYMIDAVQPKWPYVDYRPYKYLLYTIPVAAGFFFIPIPIHLYLKVSISLIISVSAPAFFSMRFSKERRGLEKALPDFIRDVAEGRKTGLSPEKSIERLSDRRYGELSKHVQRMGAQLSWGISLSKVVSTFTEAVGSWVTRAIGSLLIEVVDVGGGTIRSFSEMATFTRTINDMESERRSALRPFVFITYVAGIMVILTTFIMVYMLGEPAQIGYSTSVPQIPAATIDLLLVTAVFDSFIIGLVAGKMGESSVSDGFKHGIMLVIVSCIAVQVAKLFINIPV